MDKSYLLKYLDSNTTSDYYIEYMSFRTNHMPHAAVALYHLGATEKQFDAYMKHYKERLEPVDGGTFQEAGAATEDEDVKDLLGKRRGYYAIFKHYEERFKNEYKEDMDKFLEEVLPSLLPGLVGAALHPIIHIGYGYNVGNKQVVLEGVAYLHYSYAPFNYDEKKLTPVDKLGKGPDSMLEALEKLQKDDDLYTRLKKNLNGGSGDFGAGIDAILKKHADEFSAAAFSIKAPAEADSPVKIVRWLLDQAVILFTGSVKRWDFFILHGVTGAWALSKFLHLLPVQAQMVALRDLLTSLLAVYVVQERPVLSLKQLYDEPSVEQLTWKEIIESVLKQSPDDLDEHVLKVVQVAYLCSKEEGVDGKMKEVYKRAALTARDHPVIFGSVVNNL